MAENLDYKTGDIIAGTVYQVVRTIGAGGMGTVYDVEDTTIGKRYVLKTLHPELGERDDLARRMQAEARTLARLNHPNIVEVVTAGVTADELRLPYYVMERLNGQNLRYVIEKKGALELPQALHIAIDLLDALDHAHEKGVVHRDVKPDNIFLHKTAAGVTVTKLLDFGIMSLLDGGKGETGGRFLGTLRYTSPEQLQGGKPTPKMDLYAAALVLYEMITGVGPFDSAGEQHRVAAARLHNAPPKMGTIVTVSPELESIVRAALSIDPAARPRDAYSFAATLRNLKRSMTSTAPRPHESTENRATENAVLTHGAEPPRPPVVKVQPDVAMTPIAGDFAPPAFAPPAGAVSATGATAATPGPAPVVQKTTMVGMSAPTMSGATLENAPPSAALSSGAPPSVDRSAATRSFVGDTPRMPQHGTEAPSTSRGAPASVSPPSQAAPTVQSAQGGAAYVVPVTMRIASSPAHAPLSSQAQPPSQGPGAGAPPGRVPTSQSPQFVWPTERLQQDRSEGAQVHSINTSRAVPPRRRGGMFIGLAAVLGLVVVGIFVVITWQMRARSVAAAAAGTSSASPSVVSSAPGTLGAATAASPISAPTDTSTTAAALASAPASASSRAVLGATTTAATATPTSAPNAKTVAPAVATAAPPATPTAEATAVTVPHPAPTPPAQRTTLPPSGF